MNTRMTIFTAQLHQDSALSISGIDQTTGVLPTTSLDCDSARTFTCIDGIPVISGRGLKGAAVAMARRFFDPLPQEISGQISTPNGIKQPAPLRSAWEFSNTRPLSDASRSRRAGVAILHKTGARKEGGLYDQEIIPAGCRWSLEFCVNWLHAGPAPIEVEGILGYILQEQWAHERCWLGGGVARGLGWCHITDLQAFRLNDEAYTQWVTNGRHVSALPRAETTIPIVLPTRSWCFATRDISISFGEYRPDATSTSWGVDMLAIGTHRDGQTEQELGKGSWAQPWRTRSQPETLTNRALLLENAVPLIPGSGIRGPLRHAFSRFTRQQGLLCQDPAGRDSQNTDSELADDDPGGKLFGTTHRSSSLLIRDAIVQGDWSAAILHHHAEDEFSAGVYGVSKRDAARILSGTFSFRIVIEGPTQSEIKHSLNEINRLIALGTLGQLPIGGDKTRGAGWGTWNPATEWAIESVSTPRLLQKPSSSQPKKTTLSTLPALPTIPPKDLQFVQLLVATGDFSETQPELGRIGDFAQNALPGSLTAWWCEPSLDFSVTEAPPVFGRTWPDPQNHLRIDEVLYCSPTASLRVVKTATGSRWILCCEISAPDSNQHIRNLATASHETTQATFRKIPVRLHQDFRRFSADLSVRGSFYLHEWCDEDLAIIGYTILPVEGA